MRCYHLFWHQTFLFCPFLLSHFPTPTSVYLLLIYMSVTTSYGNKVLFFSQKQICTACTFGNIPPPCCRSIYSYLNLTWEQKRDFSETMKTAVIWNKSLYCTGRLLILFSFCRHLSNILLFHLNVDSFGRLHPVAVSSQLFGRKSGK